MGYINLTPEQEVEIVLTCKTISSEQKYNWARFYDPKLRGQIAAQAPGLSVKYRYELVKDSNIFWKGQVALNYPRMQQDLLFKLAQQAVESVKHDLIWAQNSLNSEQRFQLALTLKSYKSQIHIVQHCKKITRKERETLYNMIVKVPKTGEGLPEKKSIKIA